MKQVLSPDVAGTIFIQSALFCAKVDSEPYDPGRWQLTPFNGLLYVIRRPT